VKAVQRFALAAGDALEELVQHLPEDVQHRLAEAVQGGARLALGISGGAVFLELVDGSGERHRIATVEAPAPRLQ